MADGSLDRTARRLEAIRRILTNLVWIAIVVVVLAAVGRYLISREDLWSGHETPARRSAERPVVEVVAWNEVDAAIADAVKRARESTEAHASEQMDVWTGQLMGRIDDDFLEWYFGYWTQQILGLEGLWQHGVHYFFESQPTAAERMTEEIQAEFARRVLRPQVAELELERIVRSTADHFVARLRENLAAVPATYKIPVVEWDRYLEGFALTTSSTEGGRETPLTLKALVASTGGGAVLLAAKLNVLLGKLSGKVIAKSAGAAASKLAAATGAKVAAKAGGKFLGPIVGVGILVWDVWDHQATEAENRPILRKALQDYLAELKDILLHDPESGIVTTFVDMEKQLLSTAAARAKK